MTYLKKTLTITLLFTLLLTSTAAFSQMAAIKKFDFKELEGKTLYIPTYKASASKMAKMAKKGKFEEIEDLKAREELYNSNWKEAMAESSYEVSDYEIKSFNRQSLIKSKSTKAILLYYQRDDYGNWYAHMMVTGPKRRRIASTYINGFDLSEKNDIRLMINLLNDALSIATEVEEDGDKSRKQLTNKYKQRLVDFYDVIGDKTFMVPKSTHKKPKKATERNADLKEALKNWKLSEYEFTTEEEIEKKRLEGDSDSFYWRDIPVYTNSFTMHYNLILSTDGDNLMTAFMGKGRLKPATLDKIQEKITNKANRYKKQLSN